MGQDTLVHDKTDADWSWPFHPCFGSSHTPQTVWNSLRGENRLKVVFQILFSRSYMNNNLVMWSYPKPPSPYFSTEAFSQVTAVCFKFHTFPVSLVSTPTSPEIEVRAHQVVQIGYFTLCVTLHSVTCTQPQSYPP